MGEPKDLRAQPDVTNQIKIEIKEKFSGFCWQMTTKIIGDAAPIWTQGYVVETVENGQQILEKHNRRTWYCFYR